MKKNARKSSNRYIAEICHINDSKTYTSINLQVHLNNIRHFQFNLDSHSSLVIDAFSRKYIAKKNKNLHGLRKNVKRPLNNLSKTAGAYTELV